MCGFKKEAPDGWVEVVNKTLNIIEEVRSK